MAAAEGEQEQTAAVVVNHISVLEERFLFAARRRERIIEENPYLTQQDMWAIDLDLEIKRKDLEEAIEFQRRRLRKHRIAYNAD